MSSREQSTSPSASGLTNELIQELSRLQAAEAQDAGGEDPWRFRAVLRQILGEAWAGVAQGKLTTLGALLRGLVDAEAIVRPHLPDLDAPRVEAAREVYYVTHVLHLAQVFVSGESTRARLADRRRSMFERKVLQVLLEHRDEYLRRADILRHMMSLLPPPYPDPSRISQILSDLYEERLLMRIQKSAQGNPQTSFFTLSQRGVELCQRLDLEVPRLFEHDVSKWGHLLRPSLLAAALDERSRNERIATFYRPRHGVGCSLALARSSVLLAEQVKDLPVPTLLVLDLDTDDSLLKDYFGAEAASCRGLSGLLEDYEGQSNPAAWLEEALFSDEYTFRPPEAPANLLYLPPFSRSGAIDQVHLYTRLMKDLRRVGDIQKRPDGSPALAGRGFLGDLRQALLTRCAKALVQAPSGLGPGAYVATVLLADEIVLFLRPSDPEHESTRSIMREVLGNCLMRGQAAPDLAPSFTFAFSQSGLDDDALNLPERVRLLLVHDEPEEESVSYRIVPIPFDWRFAFTIPDLASLRSMNRRPSLVGAGYHTLVASLHPNAALTPAHWDREYQITELLRGLAASSLTDRRSTTYGEVAPATDRFAIDHPESSAAQPRAIIRHEEDMYASVAAAEAACVR